MIKKELTYEDLDGNKVTETFEFHISKAELTELELGDEGGTLTGKMKQIAATNETYKILKIFKTIIQIAYGKRSEDGKRFIKTEKQTEEFIQSEAYSALIMEVISDPMAMVNFLLGAVPQGVSKGIDMQKAADNPEVAAQFPEQAKQLREMLNKDESEPESETETNPAEPTKQEIEQSRPTPPIERPRPLDHLPKEMRTRRDRER